MPEPLTACLGPTAAPHGLPDHHRPKTLPRASSRRRAAFARDWLAQDPVIGRLPHGGIDPLTETVQQIPVTSGQHDALTRIADDRHLPGQRNAGPAALTADLQLLNP